MAKDVNPVQAQHKKEKSAQLKKLKQQRAQTRTSRLTQLNPVRTRQQIEALEKRQEEQNGRLLAREKQLLETLTADLAAYEKGIANGSIQQQPHQQRQQQQRPKLHNRRFIRRTGGRGRDSIYWDPVLNPFGVPVPGYPDLDRPTNYDGVSDESDTDESVRAIPLPAGPPPGSRAAQVLEERGSSGQAAPAAPVESKTVYSSAPVMRDFVKEAAVLVPVSVQRKRAAAPLPVPSVSTEAPKAPAEEPSNRQPLLEDYYGSDEEASDGNDGRYGTESGLAPEEEAYLRAQGSGNDI